MEAGRSRPGLFVSEQNTVCLWRVSLARMYDILTLYIYASHPEMHVCVYSYIVHAGTQIPDKYTVATSFRCRIHHATHAGYTYSCIHSEGTKISLLQVTQNTSNSHEENNTHDNNCFYFMIILLCTTII